MASAGRSAAVSVLRLCLFRHNSKILKQKYVFKSASSEPGEIHAFFGSLELWSTHRRLHWWHIAGYAEERSEELDVKQSLTFCPALFACVLSPGAKFCCEAAWIISRQLWLNGTTRLGYPAVPPVLLAFPSKAPRFARPQPNKQCIIGSAQQGGIQFTQTTCLFEGETLLPQVRPTWQDRNVPRFIGQKDEKHG